MNTNASSHGRVGEDEGHGLGSQSFHFGKVSKVATGEGQGYPFHLGSRKVGPANLNRLRVEVRSVKMAEAAQPCSFDQLQTRAAKGIPDNLLTPPLPRRANEAASGGWEAARKSPSR